MRIERLMIQEFDFRGLAGSEVRCPVRLQALRDGRTLALAGSLIHWESQDRTARPEELASGVVKTFRLDPFAFVWIEAYTAVRDVPLVNDRDYCRFTFGCVQPDARTIFRDARGEFMRTEDWVELGLLPPGYSTLSRWI